MDIPVLIPRHHAIPLITFIAGIVAGWISEKIVLKKLNDFAATTETEFDDILIDSVKGITFFWLTLLGAYIALHNYSVLPVKATIITDKAIVSIWIMSCAVVLSRFAVGTIEMYSKKQSGLPSTSIFSNLARILIFLMAFLIILQSLGISIAPILTALGVGGLAVALALQDTLSNLFSGIQILVSRQVKPGNLIKLENGDEGTVTDISWRNTLITTAANNTIVVPNAKMASNIITNYHTPSTEIAVVVGSSVAYSTDLEKAEKIAVEAGNEIMKKIPGGVPEFNCLVRFHTFGDSGIAFNTIMRAKTFGDQFPIKHEFVKLLKKRFAEAGIEIPFPTRTVYLTNQSK